jgi:hypothetical protein
VRREPSLTFEGALRIVGRHEPRLVGKLDTALGGVILAAGAGVGAAALGGPALAPAAMFAAVWGLTEQKNEAMSLLQKAVSAASGKLAATQGYERRQLLAAAHTTIVVAAFFESFRERVGKEFFSRLKITDAEKETLIAHRRESGETIYDILYAAEIPAPSPVHGFEENVHRVESWYVRFTDELGVFLRGLSVSEHVRFEWSPIIGGAVERYRSRFLALSAKVPEFMIWVLLSEGAATRAEVVGVRADIAAALAAERDALGRVESLLALDATSGGAMPDPRAAVARANGAVLGQRIIPEDARGYGPDVTFPTVGDIYISPRYRMARPDGGARPADDDYWDSQPARATTSISCWPVSSPRLTRRGCRCCCSGTQARASRSSRR